MNLDRRKYAPKRDALDAELESEILRLAIAARRDNAVEAVMRLRALIEISDGLDTDDLVAMAVRVSADRYRPGISKLAS